jgi:hypothetical protein
MSVALQKGAPPEAYMAAWGFLEASLYAWSNELESEACL